MRYTELSLIRTPNLNRRNELKSRGKQIRKPHGVRFSPEVVKAVVILCVSLRAFAANFGFQAYFPRKAAWRACNSPSTWPESITVSAITCRTKRRN